MQYTQVIKFVFPKVWENSHACKYELHVKKKKKKTQGRRRKEQIVKLSGFVRDPGLNTD